MVKEEQQKVFEQALDNAWKDYVDRGAATVDALEENTQELTFAKGYNTGYKQALEYPTGGELLYVLNKGHKQGWKEAVEKACEFFNKRMIEIEYPDDYATYVVDDSTSSVKEFIKDFKEYMEEQQ